MSTSEVSNADGLNFWFYCHSNIPEVNPKDEVFWAVEGKQTYENYEKYRNRFKNEVESIGVQIIDEIFVLAEDIPKIKAHLLKLGWTNKYIPFGP